MAGRLRVQCGMPGRAICTVLPATPLFRGKCFVYECRCPAGHKAVVKYFIYEPD